MEKLFPDVLGLPFIPGTLLAAFLIILGTFLVYLLLWAIGTLITNAMKKYLGPPFNRFVHWIEPYVAHRCPACGRRSWCEKEAKLVNDLVSGGSPGGMIGETRIYERNWKCPYCGHKWIKYKTITIGVKMPEQPRR